MENVPVEIGDKIGLPAFSQRFAAEPTGGDRLEEIESRHEQVRKTMNHAPGNERVRNHEAILISFAQTAVKERVESSQQVAPRMEVQCGYGARHALVPV